MKMPKDNHPREQDLKASRIQFKMLFLMLPCKSKTISMIKSFDSIINVFTSLE